MKHTKFFISALALLCLQNAAYAESDYKNKDLPVETRVADLLSKMTLDEKIMQLTQYTLGTNNNPNNIGEAVEKVPAEVGSVIYFDSDAQTRNSLQKKAVEETRLGIPVLFGYDVIHGFRTVFAVPLAQACTWNPELVRQGAAVAAQESRMSGVDWTFSPMIDVARDGRWGRIMEGYGEDPYATSVYTVAAVKGYQGESLSDPHSIAACLKHFVGYGASEAGRDYVYTEISAQTLWDTYLPPYEAGVKAGAATLMSAFNDISGVPASANHYTLTEILKQRWGHQGFVVSDWDSVVQLVLQGVAKDEKEAAEKAFMAGVEMDMNDGVYAKYLAELVEEGKVPMSRIDDAVSRILRVKFQLGLFENPYTKELPEAKRLMLPESMTVVERLAEETMVLLKNEDKLLPLKSGVKIALVGPLAKAQDDLLGSWSAHGRGSDVTTLFDAISAEFGAKNVLYANGCSFEDTPDFSNAVKEAKKSDVIVACLGEPRSWSGENTSRTTIAVPEVQVELLKQLKSTGKKIIVILSNGRPLDLSKVEPLADAILEIWQPGVPGGRPAAGALSGRVNPSGKLAVTFPYSTGQIPIYYNRRKPARLPDHGLYKDMTSEPLYSFGHGLSYSNFEYGKVSLSATSVKKGGKLKASVTVKNTGDVDGAETVMWFISDPYCRISRPVMELKHFEKKMIPSGKSAVYEFEIDTERDFSFVDSNGSRFLESGDYYLIVNGEKYKIEVQD